jgi:hypothetical protein
MLAHHTDFCLHYLYCLHSLYRLSSTVLLVPHVLLQGAGDADQHMLERLSLLSDTARGLREVHGLGLAHGDMVSLWFSRWFCGLGFMSLIRLRGRG